MKSNFIEHIPHEACGSSDALAVYEDADGFNGYCWSCDTAVAHPYLNKQGRPRKLGKFTRTKEEIENTLKEIDLLEAVDLEERKLRAPSLDYFGIRVGLSEQDGETPVFHYYPYTKNGIRSAYKVRQIEDKRMWSIGDLKDVDLFGWEQAKTTGAKTLYITEGELDAPSLFQALKDKSKGTKWAEYNPAVVSLINGAGSAKRCLMANQSKIRDHFKDIVLVFDQDEAGEAATEAVMHVFPSARAVTLPSKDPSQCLQDGRSAAMCNSVLFKAERPKNTRLIWGREVIQAARVQPKMGLDWPWERLTKLTRGIRLGETIYIGSGVKMGKTTVVSTLAAYMIVHHKMKVFLAQPEESVNKSFKLVTGKVANRIFHDPNIPFDFHAYDKVSPLVGENLCMLNLYQNIDWHNLRVDITAAVEEGCQAIFIDPITNITNGINAAQANTILQEIAQELATIAKDLNIVVFIFCHLKSPDGLPHERGGKVYSAQFAGSRAMMRSCNLMLGLEGDKDPDLDPDQQDFRRLVILEDREFGSSGYVNLWYDKMTGMFNEVKEV